VKRSNTANVDPRTINFADVKKRLEDKIDRINSYQPKKGFKEAPRAGTAGLNSNSQPQNNPSRFSASPQNDAGFNPNRFSANPQGDSGMPQSSGSGFNSNAAPQSDFGGSQGSGAGGSQNPFSRQSGSGYGSHGNDPFGRKSSAGQFGDRGSYGEEADAGNRGGMGAWNRGGAAEAGSQGESRYGQNALGAGGGYSEGRENQSEIQRKLDFLEQERLSDLRNRASDSKLSYLADSLGKIEGRLDNLQNPPVGQMDVSLEIIQRKLDKLEQDRIDSLRSKIEQERARELEKSIEKLGAKIEDSYIAGNTIYNKGPSDLELIQRKLDKLEQDKLDALKYKLEEDRSSEIVRNLEKIESKLTSSVDKSALDKAAYLEALSKEDLLRKIDKLEQDRINDIKNLVEQEKAMLINKQIEKLESKLEQALSNSAGERTSAEASAELAKKLERIEQAKIEETRARKEEEKLLALSRSLANIESKLGEKQVITTPPDVMRDFLNVVADRLQRLEQEKYAEPVSTTNLERSLASLESKIEKISYPDVSHKMDSRYAALLEGIERKLSRLEQDKVDEYKQRSESDKISELSRSLDRIEGSIANNRIAPFSTGVEGDGLGKKFDKLEQDIRSSLEKEKISNLQRSLDKIETKLDFDSKIPPSYTAGSELSSAFAELSKRLDNLEKKRAEDISAKENSTDDSKLTAILEKIENKIQAAAGDNQKDKKDFFIEEIQRKISALEESKAKDLLLNAEREKFNNLSNYVEKLDSKINDIALSGSSNAKPTDDVARLADKIAKIEKNRIEETKEKQNLERFNNLSNYMEKLDSKINSLSSANNSLQPSSEITQLADKIDKIEQNRLEEIIAKQKKDHLAKIDSKLEKIETKLLNQETSGNNPAANLGLDNLHRKLEKQQDKISELQAKLEQEKFASLTRHLHSLEQKIDAKNIAGKDAGSPALENISRKIDSLTVKDDSSSLLQDIKNHLSNLESKKDDAHSKILLEIKNHLHGLTQKNSDINNPILLDIKNKIDSLNSKDDDSNKLLFIDLQNQINNLAQQKDDANNSLLLDIKNKLDNVNFKNTEAVGLILTELKNALVGQKIQTAEFPQSKALTDINHKLDSLLVQKNDSSNSILENISERLANLESQKNLNSQNAILVEIKSHLDKLHDKINANDNKDSYLKLDASILDNINNRLDNLISKGSDSNTPLLLELKNKLDSLSSNNNDSNRSLLIDLQNRLNNLYQQKNEASNPILLEIKSQLEKNDNSNNAVLKEISSRIDNLESKKNDSSDRMLIEIKNNLEQSNKFNNSIFKEISEHLNNLNSHTGDSHNLLLRDIQSRLDNLSIKVNEAKDSYAGMKLQDNLYSALEHIKNKLNSLLPKENNHNLSADIKDYLKTITLPKEDINNELLKELKNKLDKQDIFNNSILIELKNILENLKSQGSNAENNSSLAEMNRTLERVSLQNNNNLIAILSEIKSNLDSIEEKNKNISASDINTNILLELKYKLDNLGHKNHDVNSSAIAEIKDLLETNNYTDSASLREISNRLDKLESQKDAESQNTILADIKNRLSNLESKKGDSSEILLLEIKHKLDNLNIKDEDSNKLLLTDLQNRINALYQQQSNVDNTVLLEIKNKLDNISFKNHDSVGLLLAELKNTLNGLKQQNTNAANNAILNKLENFNKQDSNPLWLEIIQKLNDLNAKNSDNSNYNLLLDIKNALNSLVSQNSNNNNLLYVELKNKLDTLNLSKNDANNALLLEIKNQLDKQKFQNSIYIDKDSPAPKTEILLKQEENNKLDGYLLNKNNEKLEDIAVNLLKFNNDIKNLSNNVNNNLQERIITLLNNIHDKYLDKISQIESSMRLMLQNDNDIKGYILEQEMANAEISKLKNQLAAEKDIAQRSFLLNEISKLKSADSSDKNLSNKSELILSEIRNQQDAIKKSIETLPLLAAGEKDSPIIEDIKNLLTEVNARSKALNDSSEVEKRNLESITEKMNSFFDEISKKFLAIQSLSLNGENDSSPIIEDIKNLLTEVNTRNKALNDSAEVEKKNLDNIVEKMDKFFASIAKIEEVIAKIVNSESLGEKYKQSLEENFVKLKEDNSKIIEGLKNNTQQSNLLSEKTDLLLDSLRKDMQHISQTEQKSIIGEFTNLRGIVLEFKNFIKSHEDDKSYTQTSADKLVSNLDNIAALQEETLSYFKSLDSKMANSLVDLQKSSTHGYNSILSEIKLYLEDTASRTQYFNQLKDKLDQNNLVITEFLNKLTNADKEMLGFSGEFKIGLESLSNTMASLLSINNKQTVDLYDLIGKTEKLLSEEPAQEIKKKLEEIKSLQKNVAISSQHLTEKTKEIETTVGKSVDLLQDNLNTSKAEMADLIKDTLEDSTNKITGMQQSISNLTNNVDMVFAGVNVINNTTGAIQDKVIGLQNDVLTAQKDINANTQNHAENSLNKLQDLYHELSNVDSSVKVLKSGLEDIKTEVSENKFYQKEVSQLVKLVLSSSDLDNINFAATVNNMLDKVAVIDIQQKNLENLINNFQKEIQLHLSPFVIDKNFAENFNKFVNFNASNIKNLKDSIKSFNSDLNIYLMEDSIMTNEQLVNLLTSFEEILNFQDDFFKIYSLNSENLMNFAKKTEQKISKVDVNAANKIHHQVKQAIVEISPKNKEAELAGMVAENNAKNSKKVDLLANMDYLNKEITKKTTAD